jgi:hypothetical protein
MVPRPFPGLNTFHGIFTPALRTTVGSVVQAKPAHEQPGPQPISGRATDRATSTGFVATNVEIARAASTCPLGQAIFASASAIDRRDSNVAPHDRQRYS